MLDVNIEKILPVTEVRDSLNKIVDEVESSDELYVVTKNGKPSAILVGVHHLEKLTGINHKELMPDDDLGAKKTDDKSTPGDVAMADLSSGSDSTPQSSLGSAASLPSDSSSATPSTFAPTTTIPAVDENTSPSTTPVDSNVIPSSFSSPSQTPAIAPTTPPPAPANSFSAPPAANSSLPQVGANEDSVDDIFGPIDEPEAPVTPTSAASPSLPSTPTSYPVPTTPTMPAASPSSTIAGPLPAASPAPATTPPAQNPPAMPGSI